MSNLLDKMADKVRWVYLSAFFILLLSYIIEFSTTQELLHQANLVDHTNIVINKLDNTLSKINEGESAFRGYIITRDEKFLSAYLKTSPVVDTMINKLKLLIEDNPEQISRLAEFQKIIQNKYQLLADGFSVFQKNNYTITDSLKAMGEHGKLIMDTIRGKIIEMQHEETKLITQRSAKLESFSSIIKLVNIFSLIVAISLAFYAIITFNKESSARREADRQASSFRAELELRINELNKLNTELVELRSLEKFSLTGRISRTIAHEVRNPLTNINLAAEQLSSEISGEESEILLNMITRNSNRINQLISDLLNSTKVTALNFENISVNEILDLSLDFAKDRVELKRIKVIKNYSSNLRKIKADVQKMMIAFLNIIVNAIEAMEPDKGILEITTTDKNERCVVTIKDNGKGIDAEELSKLFDPYFTTKENGTGLGLTNTQNIILSHKANVIVESETGKGTTFTISINYA